MYNDGFNDFTNNGKCSECGACCSNRLPLTPLEIKRIGNYIKKHKIKARTCNAPVKEILLDMTCPFLTEENKCNIYKVRPKICILYKCDMKGLYEDLKEEYRNNKSELVMMRQLFYGKKDKKNG